MSASLVFEPVRPEKYTVLCDGLKNILRGTDILDGGSGQLDSSNIPYLNGLKDASKDMRTIKDIQKLISAIEKYGEVNIWLQY